MELIRAYLIHMTLDAILQAIKSLPNAAKKQSNDQILAGIKTPQGP
jgi:hypothetical protein